MKSVLDRNRARNMGMDSHDGQRGPPTLITPDANHRPSTYSMERQPKPIRSRSEIPVSIGGPQGIHSPIATASIPPGGHFPAMIPLNLGRGIPSAFQPASEASLKASYSHSAKLRRGKWTPEEEAYANRIIKEFKNGILPLAEGTTLRTFLAKLLNCDPMRISKKYVGSQCIGKQIYRKQTGAKRPPPDVIEKSQKEIAELERIFLERVAKNKLSKGLSSTSELQHQNSPGLIPRSDPFAFIPHAGFYLVPGYSSGMVIQHPPGVAFSAGFPSQAYLVNPRHFAAQNVLNSPVYLGNVVGMQNVSQGVGVSGNQSTNISALLGKLGSNSILPPPAAPPVSQDPAIKVEATASLHPKESPISNGPPPVNDGRVFSQEMRGQETSPGLSTGADRFLGNLPRVKSDDHLKVLSHGSSSSAQLSSNKENHENQSVGSGSTADENTDIGGLPRVESLLKFPKVLSWSDMAIYGNVDDKTSDQADSSEVADKSQSRGVSSQMSRVMSRDRLSGYFVPEDNENSEECASRGISRVPSMEDIKHSIANVYTSDNTHSRGLGEVGRVPSFGTIWGLGDVPQGDAHSGGLSRVSSIEQFLSLHLRSAGGNTGPAGGLSGNKMGEKSVTSMPVAERGGTIPRVSSIDQLLQGIPRIASNEDLLSITLSGGEMRSLPGSVVNSSWDVLTGGKSTKEVNMMEGGVNKRSRQDAGLPAAPEGQKTTRVRLV